MPSYNGYWGGRGALLGSAKIFTERDVVRRQGADPTKATFLHPGETAEEQSRGRLAGQNRQGGGGASVEGSKTLEDKKDTIGRMAPSRIGGGS